MPDVAGSNFADRQKLLLKAENPFALCRSAYVGKKERRAIRRDNAESNLEEMLSLLTFGEAAS